MFSQGALFILRYHPMVPCITKLHILYPSATIIWRCRICHIYPKALYITIYCMLAFYAFINYSICYPNVPKNKIQCMLSQDAWYFCHLTHSGIVTLYGDTDFKLSQHWLRWWLGVWQHLISLVMSCGIHLRGMLPWVVKLLSCLMSCTSPRGQWVERISRCIHHGSFLVIKVMSPGEPCAAPVEGILSKGPYLPCVCIAGRALSAGYPRCSHANSVKSLPSRCVLFDVSTAINSTLMFGLFIKWITAFIWNMKTLW